MDLRGNHIYRTDLYGNIVWVNDNMLHILEEIKLGRRLTHIEDTYIYKIIDEEDKENICPINHETIKKNDKYMECNECNNKFCEALIKRWLIIQTPNNKNCPMCRSCWTNFNIYINAKDDNNVTDNK